MRERRTEFLHQVGGLDAQRLIFLDESGAYTNMIRLYGRAPKGERCVDQAPAGHWNTTTMLTAIRAEGLIEPASLVLPGAMDGAVFRQYIQEHLAPQLRAGDIVVMDNLNAHHVSGVREAIEARSAQLWYLPPYSPDFNPIEKLWSKVKTLLRATAARSLEQLTEAVGAALRKVCLTECRHYFQSCGYAA